MLGTPFVETTHELLRKSSSNEILPKLKFLMNSIFEIVVKSEKVCNISYDLIPKLFAFESAELYTEFLNISADNDDCIKLYKKYVGTDYDEFMFITISFINYLFEQTHSDKVLVLTVDNENKKLRIISKPILDEFKKRKIDPFEFDLTDQEYNGSINLNITVH